VRTANWYWGHQLLHHIYLVTFLAVAAGERTLSAGKQATKQQVVAWPIHGGAYTLRMRRGQHAVSAGCGAMAFLVTAAECDAAAHTFELAAAAAAGDC
jgi:hypothetical protein